MVADVPLLKKVIEQPAKKAILVLPYVALVQENLKWLRKVVEGITKQVDTKGRPILNRTFPQCKPTQSCIRLAGIFGGSRAKATWTDVDIAVCTIEKATSLLNAAIEDVKLVCGKEDAVLLGLPIQMVGCIHSYTFQRQGILSHCNLSSAGPCNLSVRILTNL